MAVANDSRWQQLMDTAYDRWQENDRAWTEKFRSDKISANEARKNQWSFAQMLEQCEGKEAAACVFGKLNQQIENGGVQQWIDNGYAGSSSDWGLWELLSELGQAGNAVRLLLEPLVDQYCEDNELKRFYDSDGDDDDVAYEACMDACDRADKIFYSLQVAWHPEIDAYLAS